MVSNYPSNTAYAWWLMEHFWKTLAERIEQAGGRAYLAYPEISSLSETIKAAPITPVELTIPWQSQEQALDVREFLRANDIASVYFTDQPFFSPQYLRMRLGGVKHIIIHDHTPGDRPPVGGLKGALKAIKNRVPWITADKVLCVSELMRQRDITNIRIPAEKCDVVQNGISPVICAQEKRAILRSQLNVRPDSILVATTGRAHPYKRFDFIIQCAAALNNKAPDLDVVFLLVGDGPAMPELQGLAHRLGLENAVRLLGFREDVRDILCASDLALHAALGEGFSLSIIEYMSAGLPVLVPDIPSVSQAIDHSSTGIIYPKEDPMKVATYIQALTIDPERRLAMGEAAKEKANSVYSLKQCTASFISAIEAVIR